jgi:hypothetical protein
MEQPQDLALSDCSSWLHAAVLALRFSELFQMDQLRKEMEARRVFLGFTEGQLTFAPTFKVGSRCTD